MVAVAIIVIGGFVGTTVWLQTTSHQNKKPVALARVAPPTADQLTDTTPKPAITPDVHIPSVVNGVAPVVTRLPTKQNVVFLGIDDGAYKNPEVIALLKANHIKASLYLANLFISNDPGFFQPIIDNGSLVEDHSVAHDTKMSTKPFLYQKQEICGMAELDQKYYGRRPIFFRPPGGAYTLTTQRAAAACGMKAVVTWIAKANGGAMQYQLGNGLKPGDIVLMHFRPEFKQDLQAFVDAENKAGLHTELLENWL